MTQIEQMAFIGIVLLCLVVAEALYIFKHQSPFLNKGETEK